ncbi:MAG: hypothetical protein QOE83_2034 [Actinomycetota bacterium]|jgi:SAM-dependent methyltransferase|nr:hypothetical protein [Actinomycetota bacterium]
MREQPFDVKRVVRDVAAGRSVLRAMANNAIPELMPSLRGTVLDLGSGDGSGAVRRSAPRVSRWIGTDIGHHPDVRADATSQLPFREDSFDGAVCMWFLYIASDPGAVLGEIRRVLRPGATFILGVPLVFPVNPEPRDLWRFTDQGITELVRAAGYRDVRVTSLGGRWSAACYLLDPYLRPRRVVARAAVRIALALDLHADRRGLAPNPVGYLVRCIA